MYEIYENCAELGFSVVREDNIVKSTLKPLVSRIQLSLDFVLIPETVSEKHLSECVTVKKAYHRVATVSACAKERDLPSEDNGNTVTLILRRLEQLGDNSCALCPIALWIKGVGLVDKQDAIHSALNSDIRLDSSVLDELLARGFNKLGCLPHANFVQNLGKEPRHNSLAYNNTKSEF
jgi:hypothetical protein